MCRIERFFPSQPTHPEDGADGEIGEETDEDQQREYLERDPRNEDVIAYVGTFVRVGGCAGEATARGLEEEREDVAGDEDTGVGEGGDAGVLGTESGDYAGEGEVETCGEEGGGDC